MQRILGAMVLAAALAACAPGGGDDGAEAVVREIYAAVEDNIGHAITPIEAIPMTDGLQMLVERAEAAADARNEPFIEGDMAANCQDCTSLTDLEIGPQTGVEPVPAADGHVIVEARFTLNGSEPRAVLYDLVQTPEGWRVDNVLAEGFDLRSEAEAYLREAETPPETAQ